MRCRISLLAGLTLFTCVLQARATEPFTVAVIPDTQNYVRHNEPQPGSVNVFGNETQFLADNKVAKNIVFTSHVGDMVQNGAGYDLVEWDYAKSAMDTLANAEMKFSVVPGNHDYDNYYYGGALNGGIVWNNYFGANSSYFAGKSWYGGSNTDPSFGMNAGLSSWQTFSAGNRNFLHLALEYLPSDNVLAWAQNVIDTHPNMPVIVSTHSYIAPSKARVDGGMWDKFIKVNPEIFMVLCGHAFNTQTTLRGDAAAATLVSLNNEGQEVYQLLSDYQAITSSTAETGHLGAGGGWVRLMEFDEDNDRIHVRTYSTILDKYSNDPSLTDGSAYAKYWAPFNYSGFVNYPRQTWVLDASQNDFYISMDFDARLGTVPEPTTIGLLALSMLAGFGRPRRQRI